jgi:hypothetical protein
LLFPEGVGVCAEPGSAGSAGVVGSISAYTAGGGFTQITVPASTNIITFHSTSNGNGAGATWDSEDTVVASGTIDLLASKWSGYRALTGGKGNVTTYSTFWNNLAFGVEATAAGDPSTDGGLHGQFIANHPKLEYDDTTRVMKIHALDPSGSSQVVVHFTFFK